MLNIGFRPTFEGKARTIEAHLLDFDRDIYFHELSLEFVEFLRPERRFSSPQELASQLEADRNKVRQTL
jgi:riboflavin kinase/FMN adenylyltransferase